MVISGSTPEPWLQPVRLTARTLLLSAAHFATPPPQGNRRRVDGFFVQFLIDYAANSPECPPLFKAYLEEVVLKPAASDESLELRVEYYLRNPEITKYGLGSNFVSELAKYTIFDDVYGGGEAGTALPFATIPERYRPKSGARLSAGLDIEELIEQVGGDETDSSDLGGDEEEDREEKRMMSRMLDRLHALEGGHSSNRDGGRDLEAPESTGLLRRLESIPLLAVVDNVTDNVAESSATRDRTGPDWNVASWYRGNRQPPLAARLETVVNFLADEDVNRCINWTAKFAEVVSYLDWLAHHDEKHQLRTAGPQTKGLFNDAVIKAKTHALFEKHHYDPTPLEITKPVQPPLKSTRLSWMADAHNWPLPSRNPAPDRSSLLPRAIPPRPPSPVNRMLVDKRGDSHIHKAFVVHERKWWKPVMGRVPQAVPLNAIDDECENLAYIESRAFDVFSSKERTGWVRRDEARGMTLLPDNTLVVPGDPKGWARERGARRAGLQQMLRAYLPAGVYASLGRFGSGLVLPLDAATLRRACQGANGPQWAPVTLKRSQLPETYEDPMAVNIYVGASFAKIYRERERARLLWEAVRQSRGAGRHPQSTMLTTLPKSLAHGGPFVWRGLDSHGQAMRDLERQCHATLRVLREAHRRVPRPVLGAALRLANQARRGVYGKKQAPDGLRLAPDEWEPYGSGTFPRFVDADELRWLRFLGSGSVNAKTWTGHFVPDTPRRKYRLFLIFARRVQKLLDDRSPTALFARHDAQLTVEELLKAVNAGTDSGAVTKCKFQLQDACCWLDRMNKSGHVRFLPDPTCHGVVHRPVAEFFPEHRVIWPAGGDFQTRPPYLGYIADWSRVVSLGAPDVGRGSNIWNFFAALGFRLGYTIYTMEKAKAAGRSAPAPAPGPTPAEPQSAAQLDLAVRDWESTCLDPAEPYPTDQALAKIRAAVIDELSHNAVLLAPVRERARIDREGNARTVHGWDHNWDWASPAARGQQEEEDDDAQKQQQRKKPGRQRRQYWSVNRWPLETGHLSARAADAVRSDADLDPAMTYDPASQDPTAIGRPYMQRMRPFGEDYKVGRARYVPGPAVYPVGDTRLQREAFEARVKDMVGREVAGALARTKRERTWGQRLAALMNPFSRAATPRAEPIRPADMLPPVDPKLIPKSWDPQAEWERQQAAQQEKEKEEAEDADMEGLPDRDWEDEVRSVDVAMTGMGEAES